MAAWEDLLRQYGSDKNAAQREIERAKDVWMQEKARGASQERLDQISRWADQVREAAGIGSDDPVYGNNPDTYRGRYAQPRQPSRQIPNYLPAPNVPTGIPQNSASAQLIQQMLGMFGPSGNSDALRQMAEMQAQQQADAQRRQLEQLMRFYENQRAMEMSQLEYSSRDLAAQRFAAMMNYMSGLSSLGLQRDQEMQSLQQMLAKMALQKQTGLQGVEDSLADAKAALENRSFQNYLKTNQEMANRGISGSGIAADADTRLALARQQDLAGLQRDSARRRAEIEANYQNVLENANTDQQNIMRRFGNAFQQAFGNFMADNMRYANMAFQNQRDLLGLNNRYRDLLGDVQERMTSINPELLETQLFSQLQSQADERTQQRFEMLSGLLGRVLPYESATQEQMLANRLGYDRLNADIFNNLQNISSRERLAEQQSLIDWARLAGYLPNGSPTLDRQQLEQLINYQTGQQNLGWARLDEQMVRNDDLVRQAVLDSYGRMLSERMDALRYTNDPAARQAIQREIEQLQRNMNEMIGQMGIQFPTAPSGSGSLIPSSSGGNWFNNYLNMMGGLGGNG